MALYSSYGDTPQSTADSLFPDQCQLQTAEQSRTFYLLRLAFFALKLRNLQRTYLHDTCPSQAEYELHCKLLRHAIFQQVLALIAQNAREQAFQLLAACTA